MNSDIYLSLFSLAPFYLMVRNVDIFLCRRTRFMVKKCNGQAMNGHRPLGKEKISPMLMKRIMMKKERRVHRTWHNKLNFCNFTQNRCHCLSIFAKKKFNLYLKFNSRHDDIYMVLCVISIQSMYTNSRALTSCIFLELFSCIYGSSIFSIVRNFRWWILFHAITIKISSIRHAMYSTFDIS